MVAAADRRISISGKPDKPQQKVLVIHYLKAAISFFGKATLSRGGQTISMSEWLRDFIRANGHLADLAAFARELRSGLHRAIPPAELGQVVSGFNLCGYNGQGLPEYWWFCNSRRIINGEYLRLKSTFKRPVSVFLDEHARTNCGWDGKDPASARSGIQVYRHGDFRAHEAAWEKLDEILNQLWQKFPSDFRKPKCPEDHCRHVRFKLEVISHIYKKYGSKPIVGPPIDVILLRPGQPASVLPSRS